MMPLLILTLTGCGYATARDDAALLLDLWTTEYKAERGNRTQSQ